MVRDGSVVGYSTIRWWQERDDTWLYLHHGYLLPEHRDQGIGSAMLRWAEERIRQLVEKHGTARTAVIGANAMLSEQDATALLLSAGYRRVVSLVELELGDPQQLPEPGSELPAGYGRGRSGPAPNARLGGRSSIRVRTPVSLRNGPSRTLSNPYGSYDLYESEGFRRRDRGRCAGFVAADAVSDSGSGAAVSAGGAFWDVASADQQGGACRCRARVRADPVARCLTGVRVISGGLLQPRQRLPSRTVSGLLVPAPP
ncbi:GNAT family N-acetyltransferase [Streptomyces sp. NBC_00691]|uniref:GNAT family N-acetyltransferase n=1 Tax=Streptomyces sp. NBC_00691 TaxID=2903671 RepID=UPI003FA6CDF1